MTPTIYPDGADLVLAQSDFRTDIVIVNPTTAGKWLASQQRNRPVQTVAMLRYREDMRRGRWDFTGDPIRFDISGALIDGQNRLTALAGLIEDTDFVAELGGSLPFVVMRGLPTASQMAMDQGAKRTAGQQLGLTGIRQGSVIAAGVRMFLAWERGDVVAFRNRYGMVITNAEVLSWVNDHPEEIALVASMLEAIRQVRVRPSAGVAFVLKIGTVYPDQVRDMFARAYSLADLPEGSPILALVRRLLRAREDNENLTEVDHLGWMVQTWNHLVEKKSITRLQRPKGGWIGGQFPKVKGLSSQGISSTTSD